MSPRCPTQLPPHLLFREKPGPLLPSTTVAKGKRYYCGFMVKLGCTLSPPSKWCCNHVTLSPGKHRAVGGGVLWLSVRATPAKCIHKCQWAVSSPTLVVEPLLRSKGRWVPDLLKGRRVTPTSLLCFREQSHILAGSLRKHGVYCTH